GEGGAGGRALNLIFCVIVQSERLDKFLADQLALSRTQAGRLIADKRVTARGKALRASALLERGTEVTVELPEERAPRIYTPSHACTRRWCGATCARARWTSTRRSRAIPRSANG